MFTAKDFEILSHECPALRLSDMLVDKEVTEDNVEDLKEALDYLKLHEDRLRALRQNIIKKLREYDFKTQVLARSVRDPTVASRNPRMGPE